MKSVVTLACGLSTFSWAEPEINEILVSAALFPVEASQSASASTVIDRSQIKIRAPLTISDLLRDVPGLAVSRSGVLGSSTQVRARGAEGNHLLVLIDGVEANDPSQGDEVNWGTLTATDIERIEIVRGPQSALHGSDALAGVVNIITRSAQAPLSASLFSEAGSFNTRQNGITLGHKSERLNIRFGVTDLDSDGENISRQGNEKDGYSNTTFNLKGNWAASDTLDFGFAARQQDGHNEFDAIDFFTTGLPTDADVHSEFRNSTARLYGDFALMDGAWKHRLVYAIAENNNESFAVDTLSGSTFSEKDQIQYLSSFSWSGDSQRLSFLAEREQEDFHQRGPVSFFGDPNQDLSRETDSMTLEYRGTFIESLNLAASARHDDNSEFKNADTYRLEAGYQLTDNSRIRAAWGTAIKNPTFTERFGFYASSPYPFVGNPNLEPEESESWELGLDQTLLNGDLKLALTWFNAELENEIYGFATDPVTFATTAVNLEGTSKREGLELGIRARLTDELSLSSTYTYTDSTQQDSVTGQDVDELRRARHIASLSLGWQARENLQFNLNAQYNGAQNDQFFPPWPQPSRIVEMNDYTLLNLNALYSATDNLDVYLRLENVLDEDYEEVYGYQTPGAAAYIGIRLNFGQ